MRLRKRLVRHAPTIGAFERRDEPISVFPLAGVEAEHLFVNVGFEMEGARRDVRPVERPFET
jgi:hypothetical protein